MRIVDYNTFIRMPEGTVFAPYEPCYFCGGITIKTDTGKEFDGKYFFDGVMDLLPSINIGNIVGTECAEIDTELMSYDGDSNDYSRFKMFAIFNEHEIRRMIAQLEYALNERTYDDLYEAYWR